MQVWLGCRDPISMTGAPIWRTGRRAAIFDKSSRRGVEAFGDDSFGQNGSGLVPFDLMPGQQAPRIFDHLDQGALPSWAFWRMVRHRDDAGITSPSPRRAKQQLPECAGWRRDRGPDASKRVLMVPDDSSEARMPRPAKHGLGDPIAQARFT